MGKSDEARACKPEKSSSPPPEQQQPSVHMYPDWATMQAYYGPRMGVPQYFSSAVASGHPPPPYMWGPPQHMMPPYAAIYPHGGVYAHPVVPIAASAMNIDSPAKSSGNSDRGLIKKLKGFDGLAMSLGNGNGNGSGDSAEGGNENGISQSGETEGSSEGSDGNTTEGGQNRGKRSREGSPIISNGASKKVTSLTVGAGVSTNLTTELELKNSPSKMTSATHNMIPNGSLLQNERELKREKRKQSNRESARRSRLRKQAEAEELAVKVGSLNNENLTLKSEINRLTDNSEKLKLQNAKLMEKLKYLQQEGLSLSTANLLSRVDNSSGSVVRSDEGEVNSGGKLRQLLDASPRADAVAAG